MVEVAPNTKSQLYTASTYNIIPTYFTVKHSIGRILFYA